MTIALIRVNDTHAAESTDPGSSSGPFNVGDTRLFQFYKITSATKYLAIMANLAAQHGGINIWVLDDADYHNKTNTAHSNACRLRDINTEFANHLAKRFDEVFAELDSIAQYSGVVTNANLSSIGVTDVGDLGNDGALNCLLYDIKGDSGKESDDYQAAVFDRKDYAPGTSGGTIEYSKLDMIHIDIGNRGYTALTDGNEEMIEAFARELFNMCFFVRFEAHKNQPTDEITQLLSEALAHLFVARLSAERAETTLPDTPYWNENILISDAATNTYNNPNPYSEFFRYNCDKNYALAVLFAKWSTRYPDFMPSIITYVQQKYIPDPKPLDEVKVTDLYAAMGDMLKAATDIGTGGEDTLKQIYFAFMETFAADGGTVYGIDETYETQPLGALAEGGLWAYRINDDTIKSIVSEDKINDKINEDEALVDKISLKGYPDNLTLGPSHEKFYKLVPDEEGLPLLTINAPISGDERYYIAIPRENGGADLYALAQGTANNINTRGKDAYLYVVTYKQVVDTAITYSWDEVKEELIDEQEDDPELGGTDPTEPDDEQGGIDPAEPDDEQGGADPAEPDDEQGRVDPAGPDDEQIGADPTEPDDEQIRADPTEPDDEQIGADPTEPDDEQIGADPAEPDDEQGASVTPEKITTIDPSPGPANEPASSVTASRSSTTPAPSKNLLSSVYDTASSAELAQTLLSSPVIPSLSSDNALTIAGDIAKMLHNLGLFVGDTTSETTPVYRLEQPLSRIESLSLLIRLLGLEQLAIAYDGSCPFNDVPVWGQSVAAFANVHGIAFGVDDDQFDASRSITYKEFTAMLLRALGYTEQQGDFDFNSAVDYAVKINLQSLSRRDIFDTTYLRAYAVIEMSDALLANEKGSGPRLIDRLVNSGAITLEQAENFISQIAAIRA
jgi:hypothetical protein